MIKLNNFNLKNIIENLIKAFYEAGQKALKISENGIKVTIKPDGSPVTNGDLEVDRILKKKIISLTPNTPIISEESVDFNSSNNYKTFWLIDPIDGTRDFIKKKDQYTLNAALVVDFNLVAGIVYAPAKDRLFFSYGKNQAFEINNGQKKILNCKKINKEQIIGLKNSDNPSSETLKIYEHYKVSETVKISSSLKFCILAAGEADIYVAKARAYEWDIAAGHIVLEHSGGSVKTIEGKNFLYGKKNYKNLPIIAKRSEYLEK